jgi:hypothetical protein
MVYMMALYAIVKWFFYAFWCNIGVGLFRREKLPPQAGFWDKTRFSEGMYYGVIRLFIGIVLGSIIWFMGHSASAGFYLLGFIPVRWFEWSILDRLIKRRKLSLPGFWIGENMRSSLWRLGGILVSYAADFPLIVLSLSHLRFC